MSVLYPNAGNPQNGFQWYGFPMTPQQPFQSQVPQVYDPAYLTMPPVPEQQPIFYTVDSLGNYVMLAPHQYPPPPVVSSDPKGINGEYNPMRLSAAYSDGSVDSAQPHYDAYNLNTSGASRTSVGSGGKARLSPAYKTMMCNMFSTNGSCTYGPSCQYAHGPAEMRPIIPHPKYKTMLCNKFHSVYGCQYGDKCHFRHPDDPNPPQVPTKTPPPSAAKTSQRKPSHGSGKKKNGHKAAKQNTATPKASPDSATSVKAASPPPPAVVAASAETKDGKKKDSLIKFAMYHCFESYVGKNRNSKPDALKRTNSSNTIGTFTLQRYVSMKKALDYMREVKKKPQCDAAVMMKQHERECSSLKDQPQEAPAAIAKDDKINLLS